MGGFLVVGPRLAAGWPGCRKEPGPRFRALGTGRMDRVPMAVRLLRPVVRLSFVLVQNQ